MVATCFVIGAIAIGLLGLIASTLPDEPHPGDIAGLMLVLLLAIIAIVGLGTSGTQVLIFGLISNFYRTNVRGAGVAGVPASAVSVESEARFSVARSPRPSPPTCT